MLDDFADSPAALAPVLGARKDRSAGVESSGDLLMTALGEFVLPAGGQVWTQTLVDVMDRLGVRDKATRQALSRMETRGWLARERVGRRTIWSLTPESTRLLQTGADRIYGLGRRSREWDGRWSVVLASVPESDRKVRHRITTALSWAGYGSIGPGIWISPWTDDEPSAISALADTHVDATTFRAELGELGSGTDLAARAWDLPALREAYVAFLTNVRTEMPDGDPPGAGDAVHLVRVVHEWRRFPFLDPQLPVELLPGDWPASEAADRFAELRSTIGPPARAWWSSTERHFGGH